MYTPVPEATLEAPPQEGEEGYKEYVAAYKAFLIASDPSMVVPRLNDIQMDSKCLLQTSMRGTVADADSACLQISTRPARRKRSKL